ICGRATLGVFRAERARAALRSAAAAPPPVFQVGLLPPVPLRPTALIRSVLLRSTTAAAVQRGCPPLPSSPCLFAATIASSSDGTVSVSSASTLWVCSIVFGLIFESVLVLSSLAG